MLLSRMTSNTASAVRITRTSLCSCLATCSPSPCLRLSRRRDYYGNSVTLALAGGRSSPASTLQYVLVWCRSPTHSLAEHTSFGDSPWRDCRGPEIKPPAQGVAPLRRCRNGPTKD